MMRDPELESGYAGVIAEAHAMLGCPQCWTNRYALRSRSRVHNMGGACG